MAGWCERQHEEREPRSRLRRHCRRGNPCLRLSQTAVIGPIPWGHRGPFCHALSLSSLSMSWTSMRTRRATVPLATSGEWAWGGSLWRMGPTFFKWFLLLLAVIQVERWHRPEFVNLPRTFRILSVLKSRTQAVQPCGSIEACNLVKIG